MIWDGLIRPNRHRKVCESKARPVQKISGLKILREFFKYFKELLIFRRKGPHTVGRLVLIKKKPLEITNENNLRPIVVGSIMIKILENIML